MVAAILLVTDITRKITSDTRECTIGNAVYNVVYAQLRSCLFYMQCHAMFGLSLPRSMGRMKQTDTATSAIVKSHSCQLLPVVSSEGHSLLDKIQHVV